MLGGHDTRWVELFERVAELSGVRHPLLVLPREAGALARAAEAAGLPSPISAEGLVLMAQNWRYSSAKARRELGYRARALDRTLTDTIDWYRELIEYRRARRRTAVGAVAGRGRHARGRPGGRARRAASRRALRAAGRAADLARGAR